MYMSHKSVFTFYKLTLFLLFISSMYPWFVLAGYGTYIVMLGVGVTALHYTLNKKSFYFSKRHLVAIGLLFASFVMYIFGFTLFGGIEQIFIFYTLIILFGIKREVKKEILDFITNGMAILLAISLFFYALYWLGVPLPNQPMVSKSFGYQTVNYYFFLLNPNIGEFYRFMSIFAEPGHLSMGLIPLLYVNRYKLTNVSVLVLFVTELMTLSLAGYITMFMSLIILSFSRSKLDKYSRGLLLFFVILGTVFVSNLEEDSLVYKALISRVQFDDSKKSIAGNNRTEEHLDNYFDNFTETPDVLVGLSYAKYMSLFSDGGNSGYKVFLLRFGAISAIFAALFYWRAARMENSYLAYGLFFIVMLLLYQNSYPFWHCIFMGYVLGLANFAKKSPASKNRMIQPALA